MEMIVRGGRALAGEARVPSDKSILHRALIFASLAEGVSRVRFHQMGADCRSTRGVLAALGVAIEDDGALLHVAGRGPAAWRAPAATLDCGNSGTTMRLMLGALAARPFTARLTGDDSLRRRPMRRVVEPLLGMGAAISGAEGGDRAPLTITGGTLHPIHHRSAVASAQVKSAILLAALQTAGETVVEEPLASRDHTERMLAAMGAPIRRDGTAVSLRGPAALRAIDISVPGDISGAAFLLGAAAMIPGSRVTVRDVGLNPTRGGFLDVLGRMGASVEIDSGAEEAGEPTGAVTVRASGLRGVVVTPAEVPALIDELPLLAAVAARAEGVTRVTGAGELRVKESDRIHCLVSELRGMGVRADELPDGFEIRGEPAGDRGAALHGARVRSHGDHRLAMAFAVLGLAVPGETVIEGAECVSVSFPDFESTLHELATSW